KSGTIAHLDDISSGGIESVGAGQNITINNSDPKNPIINSVDILPDDNVFTGVNTFSAYVRLNPIDANYARWNDYGFIGYTTSGSFQVTPQVGAGNTGHLY